MNLFTEAMKKRFLNDHTLLHKPIPMLKTISTSSFARDSLYSFFSNVHQKTFKSFLVHIQKPSLQRKAHLGIALMQRES